MHRRLVLIIALVLSLSAITAATASASATAGGPWAPTILSVATIDPTTWYASTDRGIFRTTDAGDTWQAVTSFPAAEGAERPSYFAPLLVGYGGGVLYAISQNESVGYSTDQGQTWSWHTHEGEDWGLNTLAVQPDDPSRLILDTNNAGTLVSSDGGATWNRTDSASLDNLVLPHGGTGDAWALYGSTVKHSTNNGLNWTTQSVGVDGITGIRALADSGDGTLYALGTTGAHCEDPATPPNSWELSLPQVQYQLIASTDGGTTWSDSGLGTVCSIGWIGAGGQSHGLVAHGSRIAYLSSSSTVAVSDDGGATFSYVPRLPYATMVGGSGNAGSDLVVGTNTGVALITTDAVQPKSAGIQSWNFLTGIAVAPGDPNTLLVSLADRGLFRSADAGATWSSPAPDVEGQIHASSVIQLPTFSDATHAAFAVDAPGTNGADGMRVFSTNDAGATWGLTNVVDGWEPGGSIVYTSIGAYLPVNQPYNEQGGDDQQRCGMAVAADPALSQLAATPLTVDGVEPDCTRMLAAAVDPTDPLHVMAIGKQENRNTGELISWLYFRSLDGGRSWSLPTGLDGAFPTREWAPPLHVVYTGTKVLIWKSRSSTLCTSIDDGASFTCKEGAFATTPGGPGWVSGGFLSSFELQADGSIVASVVDEADWTDANSTIPEAGVTTHMLRSVDGGATWAVADQQESAAITDVVDLTASDTARTLKATGSRRLLVSSSGVFRTTVAFKPAARGKAEVSSTGIVVRRAGTVAVRIACPTGKRCTGYLRVRATAPRLVTPRTAFDVTGPHTILLTIPKAQRAGLRVGTLQIHITLQRTVGGESGFGAEAVVRR